MRIFWDCRSIAPHMGGIGHANRGWLRAFLVSKPIHWSLVTLFSSAVSEADIFNLVPELREGKNEILRADAGMIAPEFEQLNLPVLLKRLNIDLYFNPCFAIPAIKTTRYRSSVVHDVVFFEYPSFVDQKLCRYLRHATDLAINRADVIFTVSEFSRGRIRSHAEGIGTKRQPEIPIIRPSISDQLKRAAATLPKPPRAEQLLYLGSVEKKKGAEVLLDAFVRISEVLRERCPRLLLAGGTGGQQFDVLGEIRRRNLTCVEVLGHVSEKEKFDLLRNAAVFVFPSLYEGFGIPPLEAMAFGVPVVAAASTSLPEVLGDAAAT